MSNLFTAAGLEKDAPRPLADRLRPHEARRGGGPGSPRRAEGGALTRLLASNSLGSLIFWGPPGTGKTTVARLLAHETTLHFEQISAIFSGVADLKKVFEAARMRRTTGQGTLLFVDEIHRFNRAQQDAFLPVMEDGTITLVGATTENPSFELNAALLSRARVLVFRSLDEAAIAKPAGPGRGGARAARCRSTTEARAALVAHGRRRRPRRAHAGRGNLALRQAGRGVRSRGALRRSCSGARRSTTRRRTGTTTSSPRCTRRCAAPIRTRRSTISPACSTPARTRSIIARRLVRMAVEDIGLADPQALVVANAAKDAFDFPRLARGRTRPRAGGGLSRHRAEIERGLHRLQGRDARPRRSTAPWRRPRSSSTRRPS